MAKKTVFTTASKAVSAGNPMLPIMTISILAMSMLVVGIFIERQLLDTDITPEDYYTGYDDGYEKGFLNGTDTGYDDGFDDGYDDGYMDGFDDGYDSDGNIIVNNDLKQTTNITLSVNDSATYIENMRNYTKYNGYVGRLNSENNTISSERVCAYLLVNLTFPINTTIRNFTVYFDVFTGEYDRLRIVEVRILSTDFTPLSTSTIWNEVGGRLFNDGINQESTINLGEQFELLNDVNYYLLIVWEFMYNQNRHILNMHTNSENGYNYSVMYSDNSPSYVIGESKDYNTTMLKGLSLDINYATREYIDVVKPLTQQNVSTFGIGIYVHEYDLLIGTDESNTDMTLNVPFDNITIIIVTIDFLLTKQSDQYDDGLIDLYFITNITYTTYQNISLEILNITYYQDAYARNLQYNDEIYDIVITFNINNVIYVLYDYY